MSESADGSPVLRAIAEAIDRDGVRGSTVVVGVSGGADSVALFRGLIELQSQCSIQLIIGHLDHQLRAASVHEAEWVQQLAGDFGVTVEVDRVDISQRSQETSRGIEETARIARREFLFRLAHNTNASFIALAHTEDDQVETVLHHLLRGTGLAGLAGMSPLHKSGQGCQLWRPLLSVSRFEIERYLGSLGQTWQTDDSNIDPRFTRNRIRHELLPLLRAQFNPQVHRALLQLAEIGGETQAFVKTLALQLLKDAIQSRSIDRVELTVTPLAAQPPLLVREMCVELWRQQQWPRQGMAKSHWQRLADLHLNPDPRARNSISLPHQIQATRRRQTVIIEQQSPSLSPKLPAKSTGIAAPETHDPPVQDHPSG